MTIPSPQGYFLEFPPYQEVPLDTTQAKEALVRILFSTGIMDAFCVHCGGHSIFRSTQEELPSIGSGVRVASRPGTVDELLKARTAWLPSDEYAGMTSQDVIAYATKPKYFTSTWVCSREPSHELQFYTRVSDTSFEKVGQFPSLADLHLADLVKYRKVLGDRYVEFARGVGLNAHGIGIGAFVYLRRIFERLITAARDEAAEKDPTWDEGAYQKSRMDGKIMLLAAYLPNALVENRSVYAILSKGIHELSEGECKAYFPAVKTAIELILDEEIAVKERNAKVAENRAAVSKIAGAIKDKG